MLNRFKILGRFIKFYFRAKTKFNVHSPFVFEFINDVLEDDRNFYVFRQAEILRGELLASKDSIEVEDFGAGSLLEGKKKVRSVKSIAQSALSPAYQCQWLFRITNLYKPLTIIELGTSLGVSTIYLTEGAPRNARITSLEGSPQIARTAARNFDWYFESFEKVGFKNTNPKTLNLDNYKDVLNKNTRRNNITIVEGNFDKTLQTVLNQCHTLDLAFIDGNHRGEATTRYFEQCLAHINENSVLIFDDIHWSSDMEVAWETIKTHPSVSLTIDLFWCGLVFFRQENQEKEHFSLIQSKWKPFSWGFFS